MSSRAALCLTVFTLLSALPAGAQFTTYVAPPAPKPADSARVVAATGTVPGDTARRVEITNMKAWVDSAAGQVVGRHLTSNEPVPGATVTTTSTTTASTTTFRDGSRAPDTATPLPTLALLGAASLAAGLMLLRGRRAPGA